MAEVWASFGTLEVTRREPYLTAAAKILPLHLPGVAHPAREIAVAAG